MSEGHGGSRELSSRPLRIRRDNLLEKLGELGGGTFASMQELHERRHRLGQDLARHRAELALAAGQSLPLALIGENLLARLAKTLQAEQAHRAPVDGLKTETLGGPPIRRSTRLNRIFRLWIGRPCRPASGGAGRGSANNWPRVTSDITTWTGGFANASWSVWDFATPASPMFRTKLASMLRQQAAYEEVETTITLRGAQDRSHLELREDLKAITDQIDDLEQQRRTLDQTLGRLKMPRPEHRRRDRDPA